MPWVMEVQIEVPTSTGTVKEWRAVRSTGGPAYTYDTREEAMSMLRMCYPDQLSTEVRVREVKP